MAYFLDRRSFLTAAALLPRAIAAAPASVRWALLSDTHIAADPTDTYRGFQPTLNLEKVVTQVLAQPFENIVVNGDLARLEGRPADYASFGIFAAQLAAHAPLAVTLGNHDERSNARQSLNTLARTAEPDPAKWITSLNSGPLHFVLLDSLMATNIAAGQVGRAQTTWLANHLRQNATQPTVVFVHHNPDPNSDNALVDAERLLALLRPARQVKALVFGHTHEYRFARTEGLHLINLPAIGYNFADDQPVGWLEAVFTAANATLTLRALGGNMENNAKTTTLIFR